MALPYPVIDADAHVNPPHDFWAEYLPARFRDVAPRVEPGEDVDYVVFEGKRRKISTITALAGKKAEEYKLFGKKVDTLPGGWMPYERLKDMDKDGMHAAVLFGGGPLGTASRELYIESFEAYNRWIMDFCKIEPGRLIGVAYLPMMDVAYTIELMRRMAKLGFRSVNIPAFPQPADYNPGSSGSQMLALTGDATGTRSYSDPEFDPFWAAAGELDMTITVHLGARSARFGQPDKYVPDLLMTKLAMAEPIAILILGAVFQRHPKLKFVSVESSVGWMAFAANYMDKTWERHRHWTKSPLTEKPSFYMAQNVYASFLDDTVGINNRNEPGAGNIMWSSDYPHSETTFPNSLETIERNFAGIPEADKRAIISDRARMVYHID